MILYSSMLVIILSELTVNPGDIIQHKLQREWLMAISPIRIEGCEGILCRTKKFKLVELYIFELEPAEKGKNG